MFLADLLDHIHFILRSDVLFIVVSFLYVFISCMDEDFLCFFDSQLPLNFSEVPFIINEVIKIADQCTTYMYIHWF